MDANRGASVPGQQARTRVSTLARAAARWRAAAVVAAAAVSDEAAAGDVKPPVPAAPCSANSCEIGSPEPLMAASTWA